MSLNHLGRSSSVLRPRHIPHLTGTLDFEKLYCQWEKTPTKH